MNTNHAAEHARLTHTANEYRIKALQHREMRLQLRIPFLSVKAKAEHRRQEMWFSTMARAKELQALWHWRRSIVPIPGIEYDRWSVTPSGGTLHERFTRDTNIAQVPQR